MRQSNRSSLSHWLTLLPGSSPDSQWAGFPIVLLRPSGARSDHKLLLLSRTEHGERDRVIESEAEGEKEREVEGERERWKEGAFAATGKQR